MSSPSLFNLSHEVLPIFPLQSYLFLEISVTYVTKTCSIIFFFEFLILPHMALAVFLNPYKNLVP